MTDGWGSGSGVHRCASACAGVDGIPSGITVQRSWRHGKYRVHVSLRTLTILFLYIICFFPSFFSAARQWLLEFSYSVFFSALSRPSQIPRHTPPFLKTTRTHTRSFPVTRSFFLTLFPHLRLLIIRPFLDAFSGSFARHGYHHRTCGRPC